MSKEFIESKVGEYQEGVLLELVKDRAIFRPRMMPVGVFPPSTRVEVSRKLREMFPLGTRFRANVKICQKHYSDGSAKGDPYLRVCEGEIGVIVDSIPDPGLVARLDPSGVDGRKYYYIWEEVGK